jgi:dynein heavy chain
VWQYTKTARGDWISQSLGMVTLAGSQVWWTWETEDVFDRVKAGDKHAMKRYAAKLTGQLSDLTHMVRSWVLVVQPTGVRLEHLACLLCARLAGW